MYSFIFIFLLKFYFDPYVCFFPYNLGEGAQQYNST